MKSTTRHLKFSYILNFVKPKYNHFNLKKIKKTKSRLKISIKRLLNRSEKIPYVQVKQKNAKS